MIGIFGYSEVIVWVLVLINILFLDIIDLF